MSNQYHSLINAVAGATGKEIKTATASSFVHVSADVWGGQSVQLEIYNDKAAAWLTLTEALFTANADKVLRVGNGQSVRAITSGSGGTMAGVSVFLVPHYE